MMVRLVVVGMVLVMMVGSGMSHPADHVGDALAEAAGGVIVGRSLVGEWGG